MENVAARICNEAGGRVTTNVIVWDLDLVGPHVDDAGRLETGFLFLAKLAVDTTPVSARRTDGSARRRLGRTGGKCEIESLVPALRSCFPEYRVPKLNRRSHGVFVSEMPIEEEEEEEIDEDASIDGLEDVEKFINEDDESDFTLDEHEARKVLATAWNQKRQEISKERDFVEGLENRGNRRRPPQRGDSGSEVEELKLRTKCNRCGLVGHWAR